MRNLAGILLFTRQLATLVQAGEPLAESLLIIQQENQRPFFQKLTKKLLASLNNGETLAQSLAKTSLFPTTYIASIQAAEHSGHLPALLIHLATQLEKQSEVRQKLITAMIYPVIMTIMSFAIIMCLMIFVVPKMLMTLSENGQALPWETIFLMHLSHFMASHTAFILGVSLLTPVLFFYALKMPAVTQYWHRFKLNAYGMGVFFRSVAMALFCRTLGTLLKADVDIITGLSLATHCINNHYFREKMGQVRFDLESGIPLSHSFRTTQLFSPLHLHLITTAELSGQLSETLLCIASNEEKKIENYLAIATRLFEPLLIVIMGGIVLFIVVAILLPVFDINIAGL